MESRENSGAVGAGGLGRQGEKRERSKNVLECGERCEAHDRY